MRINVYSQEITDEVKVVEKIEEDGSIYSAVQFMLHSSPMLHHPPKEDDRSAVTFWIPKSPLRRELLAESFEKMATMVREAKPEAPLTIADYPKISQFALSIGYDNGMINRFHSEENYLQKCDAIMSSDGMYATDHVQLERWLTTLSDDSITTLAGGEESEIRALEELCPKGGPDNVPLSKIGNDFFEGAGFHTTNEDLS